MWQVYVYSFIAGVIGTNGLPHFIKGLMGHSHMTPFGKDSSAMVNVTWGWLNLVVAALFLYYSHFHDHTLRAFACLAVGSLLMGWLLSMAWSKTASKK